MNAESHVQLTQQGHGCRILHLPKPGQEWRAQVERCQRIPGVPVGHTWATGAEMERDLQLAAPWVAGHLPGRHGFAEMHT
jgi:hypothetical protein